MLFFMIPEYYLNLKRIGVNFYVFEAPSEQKLTHMTQKEKERVNSNLLWSDYYRNAQLYDDEMKEMFGTDEYQPIVDAMLNLSPLIKKGNAIYYEDYQSPFYNIVAGHRITLNKEWELYTQDIDMYGHCIAFGVYVEDKYTIASVLQKEINQSCLYTFNVNNWGISGVSIMEMFACMQNKVHRENDIIIFLVGVEEIDFFKRLDKNITIIELSDCFNAAYQELGLFFMDRPIHCNYKANQLIARNIFETLLKEYNAGRITIVQDIDTPRKETSVEYASLLPNRELEQFIHKLRKQAIPSDGRKGAIVMNCNPFTNGHRYLIEKASELVDILYIFVVEEDKSYFKFEDRIELVRRGCDDLKNVCILPSGKFMISSVTFPEYFLKEDKQEVKIDMSLDVEIFANYIAPALGITVRFVGEEPIDMITRQYNETMRRILPAYHIDLVEIPRKSTDENASDVISASRVRSLLTERKWKEIKKLVPETTFQFLWEKM